MKKLDEQAAKLLEDIIQNENYLFEVNGKLYKVVAISEKEEYTAEEIQGLIYTGIV